MDGPELVLWLGDDGSSACLAEGSLSGVGLSKQLQRTNSVKEFVFSTDGMYLIAVIFVPCKPDQEEFRHPIITVNTTSAENRASQSFGQGILRSEKILFSSYSKAQRGDLLCP